MRTSLGLGSAPGLRKLDKAIRAQLAQPASQANFRPVPALELFAQEDEGDLSGGDELKALQAADYCCVVPKMEFVPTLGRKEDFSTEVSTVMCSSI